MTYFDSQLTTDERKTIQFALQHSLNIYLDQLLVSEHYSRFILHSRPKDEFLNFFKYSSVIVALDKCKTASININTNFKINFSNQNDFSNIFTDQQCRI